MPARRRGCLSDIFKLFLIGLLFYGIVILLNPWSLHIGGRFTPFLYWSGYGKLVTKNGTYPLYMYFYPSTGASRLHLDGLRPTSGLRGMGLLCTARGVEQKLKVSGTLFGGWRSTETGVMEFRLHEFTVLNDYSHGYVDLYGRWRDGELVMEDRGELAHTFRSGLKIEHSSLTLYWGDTSDFKQACASMPSPAAH